MVLSLVLMPRPESVSCRPTRAPLLLHHEPARQRPKYRRMRIEERGQSQKMQRVHNYADLRLRRLCAFVADKGGGDVARAVLNIEENGKWAKEVGELTGTSEVPNVRLPTGC